MTVLEITVCKKTIDWQHSTTHATSWYHFTCMSFRQHFWRTMWRWEYKTFINQWFCRSVGRLAELSNAFKLDLLLLWILSCFTYWTAVTSPSPPHSLVKFPHTPVRPVTGAYQACNRAIRVYYKYHEHPQWLLTQQKMAIANLFLKQS